MKDPRKRWTVTRILSYLKRKGSKRNVVGMARYGIVSPKAFGVSSPALKSLARTIGKDHTLALALWKTGWYDARILCALIADPSMLSRPSADTWAKDLDNWAITDGLCIYLFRKTKYAHTLVTDWTRRKEEFVRRAGFSMIATLAVHDKEATNATFERYLSIVRRHASDERNGVKKAVNWALRQVGKRNRSLHKKALAMARSLSSSDDPVERWVGGDARRELMNPSIIARFK